MSRREICGRVASVAVTVALAFCSLASATLAGTTGKLTGVVLDAKKQPLAGVNVALVGVRLGAITEADGHYAILNVPAGTYVVKVGLIGYTPTTIENVSIPADRTTDLNVTLQESAVELKEVVVSARRPVVELGLTSNIATVTRDQITKLPVQELADIVNLQAGVVEGHFRGGRKDEVNYQVDGVTVNNPFDNAATVRLDRSVLEEVQVISGTFDAEYGQAMSGVVNAVLKRGTEKLEWAGEVFDGDYLYRGEPRATQYDFRPGNLQNYQLTFSGPTGLPHTLFLLSGRHGVKNGFLEGQRRFFEIVPITADSFAVGIAKPDRVPIGYTRDWLGLAKLTNRSLPGAEISYEAILNGVESRRETWDWRWNVDLLPKQRTFSAVHGLEWTQTLDPSTYFRLSVRQNWFDYRDMVFDDVWDPRYDQAGQAVRAQQVLEALQFLGDTLNPRDYNAVLFGVDETRFIQRTNAFIYGATASKQLGRTQQVKAGVEWQPTRVEFGQPGYLSWLGNSYLRHVNEPDDGYPDPLTFKPVIGSAYAQDDVEWNDLRLRGGLRFEYFNPKSFVPGDLANPANTIEGAAYVAPRAATRKITLSPRLGVSFPVTPKSSLFFAYGHFYQMPQLGQIFSNANYSVLRNLQASDQKDYGTLGNPDVKPERTIQYQFGYKQELKDWLGLDLTLFYKDIRDLLGSQVIITYNNAEYQRLANTDFGNVIGVTVALDQRTLGLVSSSLDYTWQVAKGNASDPYELAQILDAHGDPRPRQVYLNWDQRHALNLTVTVARPRSFNVSGVLRVASGQPFTPATEIVNLESNSGRKPPSMLMDVRAEKSFGPSTLGLTGFASVLNAFDTRFWNGAVFANSGSPFYSRTPLVDRIELANPTRYYGPRRIEVWLRWERSGS